MQNTETPPTAFKCDHPGCSREFTKVQALHLHRFRAHSPGGAGRLKKRPPTPKPTNGIPCPLCDFHAKARRYLATHFHAEHPGQALRIPGDQYECTICNDTCETTSGASCHARRAHKSGMAIMRRLPTTGTPPPAPAAPPPTTPAGTFYSKGISAHGETTNRGSLDYALASARLMITSGFTKVELGIAP